MITVSFSYDENLFKNIEQEKLKDIRNAVFSAAIEMKNKARTNMKSSPYKLSDVADKGILLGKLKKDYYNPTVKLHPFGTDGEGYLARIFEGSKQMDRYNWYKKEGGDNLKKPRRTGFVKPTNAISNSLDQNILNNKIRDILNK